MLCANLGTCVPRCARDDDAALNPHRTVEATNGLDGLSMCLRSIASVLEEETRPNRQCLVLALVYQVHKIVWTAC